MKYAALALGLILSTFLSAQSRFSTGVTIGAHLGDYNTDGTGTNTEFHNFSALGFQFGLLGEYAVTNNFTIRLAGTYASYGNNSTITYRDWNGIPNGTDEAEINTYTNTVELGGRYWFDLGGIKLAPGIGASYLSAYQMKGKSNLFQTGWTTDYTDRGQFLAAYAEAVISLNLTKNIYLNTGFNYLHTLDNLEQAGDAYFSPRNLGLKLEVLYRI